MVETLSFAFIAGAIASVNPCGFALLPAYFGLRLETATETGHSNASTLVIRSMTHGGLMTLGVLIAFGGAWLALLVGANALIRYFPQAGMVIGVLLVVLGAAMLAGRHIWMPNFGLRPSGKPRGDFYFGLAYGVSSLSCTLPVIMGMTGTSITGSIIQSVINFLAFGMGLGTIMIALSIAAALSREGLVKSFKRLLPYINRISGALILLAGLYVSYYWGFALFSADFENGGEIILRGHSVSGWLSNLFGSDAGQTVISVGLLLILAVGSLSAILRYRIAKD